MRFVKDSASCSLVRPPFSSTNLQPSRPSPSNVRNAYRCVLYRSPRWRLPHPRTLAVWPPERNRRGTDLRPLAEWNLLIKIRVQEDNDRLVSSMHPGATLGLPLSAKAVALEDAHAAFPFLQAHLHDW